MYAMGVMTIRQGENTEGMLFAGERAVRRIQRGWPNVGAKVLVEMEAVLRLNSPEARGQGSAGARPELAEPG
jgi:hypothetical protein